MNIHLRRSYIYLFIVALVLLLNTSNSGEAAGSTCSAVACAYLPVVYNPIPVRVSAIIKRVTYEDTFLFLGEVMATTDRPVYEVIVEVRVYDLGGNLLGTCSSSPVLAATLPGQSNPFECGINVPYVSSTYEAFPTHWSLESEQVYRPATAVITGMEDMYYGTWVYAEARNDESGPLADVYAVVWSLHQDWGITPRSIADCLAPGETVAFTEFLRGVSGGNVATIQVAAQGVLSPCTP